MQDTRILVLLGMVAASCAAGKSTITTDPPEYTDATLQKQIVAHGFTPVMPREGVFRPGAVFDTRGWPIQPETKPYAFADEVTSDVRSDRAAWLSSWSHKAVLDQDFSLSLFVPTAKKNQLKAGLQRKGVHSYEIEFGDASVEYISQARLSDDLDAGRIQGNARDALLSGYQTVIEALRVDSLEIRLYDERNQQIGVDAGVAGELLGLTADSGLEETSGGAYGISTPVYIGVKTTAIVDVEPPIARGKEREPNDSNATATAIMPSSSVTGMVGLEGDGLDVFTFRPAQSGRFRFEVTNTNRRDKSQTRLKPVRLRDADGHEITRTKDSSIPQDRTRESKGEPILSSGVQYFLAVEPKDKRVGIGYRIEASFDPIDG